MPDVYRCPIHGEVEGVIDLSGPLSNTVPAPIQCEHPHAYDTLVIVAFEDGDEGEDGPAS